MSTQNSSSLPSRRRVIGPLVLSVLIGTSLGACNAGGGATADSGDSTVDITVLADITGKGSFFGRSIQEASQFTVDELNANGGMDGKKIQLTVQDTASSTSTASSLMNEAILGNADAVIFGVLSEEALAIAPLAQEAGLPMINVQAAGDGIVETGDAIWRITPPQRNFYPKYAKYLASKMGVKRASVFYVTDNAPSVTLATKVMPQAFADVGIQVVGSVSGTSTETDLTTAVSRLLADKPDFIQTQAIGAQNVTLITQLRRAGYTGGIGGGTALGAGGLSALSKEDADGVLYYSSYVGSEELSHKAGRDLASAFQSVTGKQANTFVAETYDAFGLIEAGIKVSGEGSRAGILAGMKQVADGGGFSGAQGDPITFKNRDAVTPGVVIEWKDGRETLAPGQ
jgi:branched-chain amino acid transport system substrate-binding protein